MMNEIIIAETIGTMTDWVCLLTGYNSNKQVENEVKKTETGPQDCTSWAALGLISATNRGSVVGGCKLISWNRGW